MTFLRGVRWPLPLRVGLDTIVRMRARAFATHTRTRSRPRLCALAAAWAARAPPASPGLVVLSTYPPPCSHSVSLTTHLPSAARHLLTPARLKSAVSKRNPGVPIHELLPSTVWKGAMARDRGCVTRLTHASPCRVHMPFGCLPPPNPIQHSGRATICNHTRRCVSLRVDPRRPPDTFPAPCPGRRHLRPSCPTDPPFKRKLFRPVAAPCTSAPRVSPSPAPL